MFRVVLQQRDGKGGWAGSRNSRNLFYESEPYQRAILSLGGWAGEAKVWAPRFDIPVSESLLDSFIPTKVPPRLCTPITVARTLIRIAVQDMVQLVTEHPQLATHSFVQAVQRYSVRGWERMMQSYQELLAVTGHRDAQLATAQCEIRALKRRLAEAELQNKKHKK